MSTYIKESIDSQNADKIEIKVRNGCALIPEIGFMPPFLPKELNLAQGSVGSGVGTNTVCGSWAIPCKLDHDTINVIHWSLHTHNFSLSNRLKKKNTFMTADI